jgi:uncharacterized protein (TIGR00299 family) protein
MGKAIYLDCFAGFSANMLLSAFLDLGLPESQLRKALAFLDGDEDALHIRQDMTGGLQAVRVTICCPASAENRALCPLSKILEKIDVAVLPQAVKDNSKKVFVTLAKAKAKIQGTAVERVSFSAEAALENMIYFVGCAFALHYFTIDRIYVSTLQTGSGLVQFGEEMLPVPAPVTAELLTNILHSPGSFAGELVTAPGAALLRTFGTGFGEFPAGFVSCRIGYGAGSLKLAIPHVLRVYLGEIVPAAESPEEIIQIETNIDDLNPQFYQHVMEKLFIAGALDVWTTSIMMKKNRPGIMLCALVAGRLLETAADIILTETSSIGLRFHAVGRKTAVRTFSTVTTPWGMVKVKISSYNGKISTVSPEYEDCRQLAQQNRIPLKEVYQTAQALAGQQHR